MGDGQTEDSQGRIWTSKFMLDPAHVRIYALPKADGPDVDKFKSVNDTYSPSQETWL